ncbi:MAG: hypothetical protein LBK75_10075 [Oscillospiraceae bacterium]|nr:hypothetical protein [Oscillospiraceae bacterium]
MNTPNTNLPEETRDKRKRGGWTALRLGLAAGAVCAAAALVLWLRPVSAPANTGPAEPAVSPPVGEAQATLVPSGGGATLTPPPVTAAAMGVHALTPAQYNYYYVGQYNLFLAADMGLSTLDRNAPLGQQPYVEGMTWEDYFRQLAEDTIRYTYALSDAAQATGYALPAAEARRLDESWQAMQDYAAQSGQTVEAYLEELFGAGVSETVFREENRREALAKSYDNHLRAGFTVSDEEIQTAYDQDHRAADRVSYCYFPMIAAYRDVNGDDVLSEAEKAQAKTETVRRAWEMLDRVEDENNFNTLCVEYADPYSLSGYRDDPAFALYRDVTYAQIETDPTLAAWAFGDDRTPGEKSVLTGQDHCYVLYFIGRSREEVRAVDVRLLSFRPADVPAGRALTEVQTQAMLREAEAELEKFGTTDRSETAFETLTPQASALYEQMTPGHFSETADAWCFDPARVPGDCTVIQEETAVYLFYFLRQGAPVWKLAVREQLLQERFDAYFDTLAPAYAFIPKEGFDRTQTL